MQDNHLQICLQNCIKRDVICSQKAEMVDIITHAL